MADAAPPLRLLIVTQGTWGERIADNVGQFHPPSWIVNRWAAPRALPPVIDDPDEFLPPSLPASELLLVVGETAGLAQLVPDIARRCGALALIAPIDRNESLPPGLVAQVRNWLADQQVAAVFPKPFCSLTENSVNRPPIVSRYDNPLIAEFARHFGQPRLSIQVGPAKRVESAAVLRDAACGCGRHVAQGLAGCPADEAEHQAGMLHHHYPCLASMNQDADYGDTLMHISGNVLREAVRQELAGHLAPPDYLRPHGRVEPAEGAA